jgi:hypothetical protein
MMNQKESSKKREMAKKKVPEKKDTPEKRVTQIFNYILDKIQH